ncbi:hypothetical protein ACI8AV_13715 [Geodermatophilus sp. SYSU D00804]
MAQEDGDKEHPGMQRIRNALSDFLRYAADTMSLIDLTEGGARALLGYRSINLHIKDLLSDQESKWTADDAARLERAERSAQLAESEIERGFPLLHNHSLMGLWGALEVMVEDVSANWLDVHPETMTSEHFPKIQVELNKFLALDPLEQKRHVVAELKSKKGTPLRTGAGQFEALLDAIGLDGPLDPDVRSVLRIAQGFRNVVAHKGGRVDARLISTCPDLGLELGRPIRISAAQMQSMVFAMVMYAEEVNRRQRAASGLPPGGVQLPPGVAALGALGAVQEAGRRSQQLGPPARSPSRRAPASLELKGGPGGAGWEA